MHNVSEDAKLFAMLAHLSGILLGVFGPLIFWLVKKDKEPFVDDQGKEALNFQITVVIAYLICGLLLRINGIFFLLGSLVWLAEMIFAVIAALAANKGRRYRYPYALRLIR